MNVHVWCVLQGRSSLPHGVCWFEQRWTSRLHGVLRTISPTSRKHWVPSLCPGCPPLWSPPWWQTTWVFQEDATGKRTDGAFCREHGLHRDTWKKWKDERVYFEVRKERLRQWEEAQIQESRRNFLHSVELGSQKNKLQGFVSFCEDTIFEVSMLYNDVWHVHVHGEGVDIIVINSTHAQPSTDWLCW